MRLHFCGSCGSYIGPADKHTQQPTWDADAIAAWQAEIDRECQHDPHCRGPWQHAVRKVLDSVDAKGMR